MEILKPFIILTLSVLILLGCGQQTLKDQGLETKEISDAATTTSTTESDVEAPTVSSVSPENGASNVSTTTSITITFNESIYTSGTIMTGGSSCGSGKSYDISTSSDFSSSSCLAWEGSPTFSDSYKTLTIKPKNALSNSTTYYVRVRSDGSSKIQDNSGNTMTETKTWSFTTEGADGPPTVSSVTPANGTTNVSISTTITITFNESINDEGSIMTSGTICTIGNYQISTSSSFTSDSCLGWSAVPTKSNSYKTLTIQPAASLNSSTSYYMRVGNNQGSYDIKDYSNTQMSGEYTWSFTTQ